MIAVNLYRAWMIPKMGYYSRHPEKYSEQFRYEYDRYAINLMKKTGRITTEGFGMKTCLRRADMSCFQTIRVSMRHLE